MFHILLTKCIPFLHRSPTLRGGTHKADILCLWLKKTETTCSYTKLDSVWVL